MLQFLCMYFSKGGFEKKKNIIELSVIWSFAELYSVNIV